MDAKDTTPFPILQDFRFLFCNDHELYFILAWILLNNIFSFLPPIGGGIHMNTKRLHE